jgi:hypothetical protein
MVPASQILRHMEVLDADGAFVGLVTGVTGAEIDLAEGHEVGDAHGRIPLAWVDYTWDHKCKLRLTREEAQARWAEVGKTP